MSQILSIIIPAYNKARSIHLILDKVKNVQLIQGIKKEVIIINDSSTDETEQVIQNYITANKDLNLQYFLNDSDKGKGAALQTGIQKATGDYIIIQDADLRYEPKDYNLMLQPVLEGFADVVYGSRFIGGNPQRVLFFWHSIGNRWLTFLSNMFTNLNLTDMETCYKLFRTELLKGLQLKEKRFGFEPEVTSKIARIKNIRIYEVGISYNGYNKENKIGWLDGIRAIYCILKYNIFK